MILLGLLADLWFEEEKEFVEEREAVLLRKIEANHC